MRLNQQKKDLISRLQIMGWALLALAVMFSGTIYILPINESIYWLSSSGKEGVYVLSAFFVFLAFYCFGAILRRPHF
jgi:uncharacterized membrane protein YgdD (TMEM256/DUF423 family)